MFINGKRISGTRMLEVRDPESGIAVGAVPIATVEDTERAVESAHLGLKAGDPFRKHAMQSLLRKVAALVDDHHEEFSRLIATEGVKTITEARREVTRAVGTLEVSAEECLRLYGSTVNYDNRVNNIRGYYVYEPIGIVVAITPFNDPLNLVAHKVGPALAAGNSVILRPHPQTPLTALKLAGLFYEAGLPGHQLQVLTGNDVASAEALISDRRVGMVSFTGGTAVGERIASLVGRKRLSLELGSNCPVIVCSDADLEFASEACASGAFWAAGQNCLHVQRMLIESSVYPEFRERIVTSTKRYFCGPKIDDATTLGCIVNEAAADRIAQSVASAREQGARILTGGEARATAFEATLMENVPRSHPLMKEEIFGPVSILCPVEGLDDAIDIANETEFGLQAGIFTGNIDTAHRAADRLEFGTVVINESTDFRDDSMPFGGRKRSGLGREGVRFAIQEMSEIKNICVNIR